MKRESTLKSRRLSALREAAILGTGAYRPGRAITNAEVAALCGVDEEWITRRTGVITRLKAGPQETLVAMATEAARQACRAAGIEAADLGCVIVATMTPDQIVPAVAPQVADNLQARNAVAYDIQSGCSGFCYALAAARTHIRNASADYALVIGADRMRDITDPTDRATAALFADGAAAVAVGASAAEGISAAQRGSLGAQRDALVMSATWPEVIADTTLGPPALKMDGKKIWTWIRSDVIRAIKQLLHDSGTEVDDLCAFIPHQGNLRITEMLATELELPPHVTIARGITRTGNTGAASIPMELHEIVHKSNSKAGELALLFGFGVGLAYCGQLIRLPPPPEHQPTCP